MGMSISEDILDRRSVAHYGEAAASISCCRRDNSASSTSKCGGGTATSHRCQPNGHHRVVASAYINAHVASAPSMYIESNDNMDYKYTQTDAYLPVRQSSIATSAQCQLNVTPGCMPYLSQNLKHSTSIASGGTSKKVCQENALYFGQQHIDVRHRISRPKHQSDNQSYQSLSKNNQPLLVERNSIHAQSNVNDQNQTTNQFTTSTRLQRSTLQSGYEISTDADRNIISVESTHDKMMKLLWLYLHAMRCSNSNMTCSVRQCLSMKTLIVHISRCCGCSNKSCTLLKRIVAHYHEAPLERVENETSLVLHNVEDHLGYTPTISHNKETHDRSLSCNNETSLVSVLVKDSPDLCSRADKEKYEELTTALNSEPESMEVDKGPTSNTSDESMNEARMGDSLMGGSEFFEVKDAQQEKEQLHVMVEPDEIKVDKCSSAATVSVHVKDNISIFDLLTLQQAKDHLKNLRKLVDQTEEKAEEIQGNGSKIDINTCSLCGEQKLFYEPPIRCCAVCLRIISKGIYYYNSCKNDSSTFFCRTCFQTPGENIIASDQSFLKANLCKGENNPEASDLEEWWVECDKCKSWQHQTCALFNPVKYKAADVFYTCPNCLIQEVDSGEYDLVQSKELKAKDLQTTKLSDHLEKWIYKCLEEERLERADRMGKEFSEVPTAEGLVVRVVSSVTKRVEVKKVVLDIIKKETYPSELLYNSKAIALFQNIDGADVCLFIMYVQEYGSDCAEPNKNLLCISYLDSVKHFTPDIKTVSGEALRTFVYHQIIIGYLYYNKMLGFIGAYIWASPPRKRNDDYILNCHPKVQKVPKPDILRAWYHTMTRKATKAEIVIEHTNLYDRFFAKSTESAATITAARLPYFDGDYWPGLAEQLLTSEEVGKCQNNAAADRVLRAYRRESVTGNEQDILFMHNLGEKIRPAKEDLMMVYLHHVCKHCCNSILSGNVWICSTCKKFQLCEECYQIQQNLTKKERHPIGRNEEHTFCKIEVDKISQGASEDEAIIQHDIFDTRLAFLEFCQQNHYQFDTLRRAKHSTMMILYHLHNPNSQKHELAHTDHVKQSSIVDTQIQFYQIKQKLKLSGAFWSHTSNCSSSRCTYKYCYKMRRLFYHTRHCKTRASGGCESCQKVWDIINIHAQSCIQLQCCVPRCNDLKEWMKNITQTAVAHPKHRAKGKARMKSRIKRRKNG